MDINWSDYVTPSPVVGASDVAIYASTSGMEFPEAYRMVVTAHAGQVTDRETIAVGAGRTVVGPLFFIDKDRAHPKEAYNAYAAFDILNEWFGPDDPNVGRYVPFMSNTSTGYFCFDKSTDGPAIVFIDIGYDPDEEGAILAVAGSFSEFLDSLE